MRILLLTAFLLFFYVAAQAQNTIKVTAQEVYDTVKLSASFINSDAAFENVQGVQVELDAKLVRAGYFRLGGVFHYARPTFDSEYAVDTYSAGPQLSYDVFNGRLSVFGRALFGVTTNYEGSKAFTRTYGGGVDVNVGHLFIRPLVLDFKRIEGFPLTINSVGVGGGVRF